MKQTNQIDIWQYVEMAIRRKWLIIIPAILILSLSSVYGLISPNVYRSSTLILVEPQRVPEAYIRSTVTSPINERLRTISQQIMSRTRLEKIIEEFDLYKKARELLTTEEIIEIMREDIDLNVRGRDSFELFYKGGDPNTVANVANKLASLFIEENLKVREQQAEGTTEFLQSELDRIKKQLESSEEAILVFKQRHFGELPEDMSVNLNFLHRLQRQIQANIENLGSVENRKLLIQRQLAQMKSWSTMTVEAEPVGDYSDLSHTPQLEELKQELQNLRTRYTDKHPEVIRLEQKIRYLEAEFANR